LALACIVGCSLIYWGGYWLIAVGIAIALGVLAYSSGPYPLSHHGLGEIAVIFFFGIIPVNFTYYLQSLAFNTDVFWASVAIGLMGANVLIVNNYRDRDADEAVDKRTLAVILGRRRMASIYLINGYLAVAMMMSTWVEFGPRRMIIPIIYVAAHSVVMHNMTHRRGAALNPYLGLTALLMLFYSAGLFAAVTL
jgi:1,4-dihydroxy-2-naphthoate octaprenyltransferase